MLIEPMPSLVKTFSLVLQHEREFVGDFTSQSPTDIVAFSSVNDNTNVTSSNKSFSNNHKVPSNSGKGPKGNKLCTHYGKTNHTVETCFFKHGFPAGYRNRGKGGSSNFKSSASLAEVDSDITSQTTALDDSSTRDQFCLSKDQYNAIIALLQQTKDSSTSVNHIQHLWLISQVLTLLSGFLIVVPQITFVLINLPFPFLRKSTLVMLDFLTIVMLLLSLLVIFT